MRLSKVFQKELPFLFAIPALIWQGLFLYLPLLVLFFYSLIKHSDTTNFVYFTFSSYLQVINGIYLKVIINSFLLALITAFVCLIIAYPVAFFLATKVKKRYRTFLLVSLILPSWTNLIVQVYAWFFLLEKNSFLVKVLRKIGILGYSSSLLNNYFSMLVGTVYCWLPFMILPIYAVLEKMDKSLLEASADLGANRFQTFKNVVLPISFNGIAAGFLLVFIPVFGEFVIPILLGGGKKIFWGSVIVEKFLLLRDWKVGSAFAMIGVLLPITLILLFIVIYKLLNYFSNQKKQMFSVDLAYKNHGGIVNG